MKKFNKIVSLLLTVVMLIGSLTALLTVNVFAADSFDEDGIHYEKIENAKTAEDYTEKLYKNADEKIATMQLAFRSNGYKIYVDDFSGEVAVVNEATGEKLFTNPWDVAADKSSNSTDDDSTTGSIKEQLLSQIEISFTDLKGQSYTYTSFRMASLKDQVVVKSIKGGIRVEYTIGREQSKMLVPHYIEASRFESLIKDNVVEGMKPTDPTGFYTEKFLAEFTAVSLYEIDGEGKFVLDENGEKIKRSEVEQKKLLADFPALKDIDLMYTLAEDVSSTTLSRLEQDIKTYCPEYTYEEMEYDHEMTKYEADDENPPVFKMALEYTIDDEGLSVRLPANGIRFNESLYTLNSLVVLPYMGAGSNWNDGYNLMPDGAGALYEFDEPGVTTSPMSSYNQIYGADYAYHSLTGTYEKTIRYPVFGTAVYSKEYVYTSADGTETVVDGSLVSKVESERDVDVDDKIYGDVYSAVNYIVSNSSGNTLEIKEKKSGFLAIIEEGDALTQIASYHGGNQNDYNSVKMQFTPRPSDTYNLQESLSVSGLGEWTVVSERKYLGNYKMRYVMLADGDVASETEETVYDASWLGMAVAYRDYLTNQGVLTPLSSDDLTDDIPLYIESFGALETVERILSIPVNTMKALTSFEDIIAMYEDLSGEDTGINNINFKLTGYTNGGMTYTVPKKLKFERVVGGKKGFQSLLDYAAKISEKENSNLGIFPDFDFAYVISQSAFDGVNIKKQVSKTIDDRYASKRVYSATQQKYVSYYDLAISPAYFSEFYEKLVDNYLKYDNLNGISIGSLGNSLNSDFDEDEPYNREDSKEYTVKAFKYISEKLENVDVMTSGGNSYVWKYVDHILDVSLDSSRQSRSSSSVPFIGVVLHGSIQFAGEPLNMEGDMQYAMLKAIENGASPYFILSYQNTEKLKESSTLSKYYSIRYDIWKDDLISTYNSLNEVLGDVQDKYIIDHITISDAVRVPDTDEKESDIIESIENYIKYQDNYFENIRAEAERLLSNAIAEGKAAEVAVLENVVSATSRYSELSTAYETLLKDIATWKGGDNSVRLLTRIKNNFNILSGDAYSKLRKSVEEVAKYIEATRDANAIISANTTDALLLAEAVNRLALMEGYNNYNVLTLSQISEGFSRSMTLIDQEDWIYGMPTYIYGIASDKYVYVIGSYEHGFEAYYKNNGSNVKITSKDILNEILIEKNQLKKDLSSSEKMLSKNVTRNGELVDLSAIGAKLYVNGKLVDTSDVNIYYDSSDGVYYSAYKDRQGTMQYVHYTLQLSFASMLNDESIGANAMIREIIDSVKEYDAELGATFEAKYDEALKEEDKKDEVVDNEENEEENSKYSVDNVVVVTYGTGNTAYKYVILNYNNFSVKVTFNGIEYTIPAYNYVALMA